MSANGQRETFQVVSLDGVDAKDPRIHITNFVPSIEALEEFKIQTNAYSAEYGFGGGAQVTITMKSGTNNLHGTLFEFLRNDKFDAENYFLNFELAPGTTRAPEEQAAPQSVRTCRERTDLARTRRSGPSTGSRAATRTESVQTRHLPASTRSATAISPSC